MSDFTSKVKGAVSKATSATKEMAQETPDMKDKPEQNMSQEEQTSFKMAKEQTSFKMAKEQMPGGEQYANVSEFDMSPMSQESQKLAGSMEKEQMGSGMKDQMYDSQSHAEMGSDMKDPKFDSKFQTEMGSNMKNQQFDSKFQTEMGSSMKDQRFDSNIQTEIGSNTKDQMYDSKFQAEMGKSNMPASQCMPETGNTASQS